MNQRAGRRDTDPVLAPERVETANLPVPAAQPQADAHSGAFDAQLLGQPGQKRGLRGGQPVLDHARSAYLGAEYSGAADRRPPRGVIAKRDI